MSNYKDYLEQGSPLKNMIRGALLPFHGELIHRADDNGNNQINNTIYCKNGELVSLSFLDIFNDSSFLTANRESTGKTGEYTLGDLTSPLQTRCIDAMREAGAERDR